MASLEKLLVRQNLLFAVVRRIATNLRFHGSPEI